MLSAAPAAAMGGELSMPVEHGGEKAGDVFGLYRLVEPLGEGGFGVVWHAEQTQPMRREVALKLLKRGMDTKQVLARFEQERRVLAAMEHPCIATMLDAGVSPDGRPFFVMELLRGLPITTYCEKHAMPLREKIALFREVCGGVQHAHQKGVIHRDLKPTNILVTEVDGKPVPKIIDFGIAKALATGGIQAVTLLTQANFILGTPLYMSPEQMDDMGSVDTRSDVYALGAVLYELLTGGPPFDAQTLKSRGPQEFWRIIREQRPKRPSTNLTTHRVTVPAVDKKIDVSRLPADLDWITLCALEKEPQRRYQSAMEFAADLQRFLQDEPVSAHPPSTAYIASRWVRRHRAAAAAACISVLALVVGAGTALWQAWVAREAQKRAEASSFFLTSLLDEVATAVKNGRNPEALRLALISHQKHLASLVEDPDLQIKLITQIADLYDGMGDRRLAVPALQQRAQLIATRYGPDSPESRAADFRSLLMVIDHGSRIEAARQLTDLCRRIEQQEGLGSTTWFEANALLVRAWIKQRQGGNALAAANAAVAEARRQNFSGMNLYPVLMLQVDALEAAREFAAAETQLEECRKMVMQTSKDPALASAMEFRLIQIHNSRGNYARAVELQTAMVGRIRENEGASHRHLIVPLFYLCEFEIRARQHESAIAHAQEALAIARQNGQAGQEAAAHNDTLRENIVKSLTLLSTCYTALKRHAESIAAAQEAVAVTQQAGNDADICRALATLSQAHEAAGQLDQAWADHQALYERHNTSHASYQNRLEDLRAMSQVRLRQGRTADALEHAREAWRQAVAVPDSQRDADYLKYMAELVLSCWQEFKAKNPDAANPEELAAWQAAVQKQTQGN